MLDEMKRQNEGFFHFAKRMSQKHNQYFTRLKLSKEKEAFFDNESRMSLQKQKEIFGDDGWNAERELKLQAAGPTDLVLKNPNSGKDIIFEFKVRETYDSYIADIEKLKLQSSDKYIKYFCTLVDAFESTNLNDGRILKVNKKYKDFVLPTIEEQKKN